MFSPEKAFLNCQRFAVNRFGGVMLALAMQGLTQAGE